MKYEVVRRTISLLPEELSFDWFSSEQLEHCDGDAFGHDNFNGATAELVAVVVSFESGSSLDA